MEFVIDFSPMGKAPPRVTYYSLSLDAETCPSFNLFYAHEHGDVFISPALRPCDFRNDRQLRLIDRCLAERLASYVEPVMQKRYGLQSVVKVQECSCPERGGADVAF